MKTFSKIKEDIKKIILESWRGNRPAGSPSPPFRKGKGSARPKSHTTNTSQFWQGDFLDFKNPKYNNLSAEQKLGVLKYGNRKYDTFKNGGFKHYIKVEDLPKKHPQLDKIKQLNGAIATAEGLAKGRADKFFKAVKKQQAGLSHTIDIKRSNGQTEHLTPKQGEEFYKVSILYQRYKATMIKEELDSILTKKKKRGRK